MKIGIIVHSHTGNTLSVANKLKDELIKKKYDVNVEQVIAVNEEPSAVTNIELKNIPEINTYDMLIFAAPVRGLSLSPVMKAYLLQIPSLQGKKVKCFVTQFFPFEWMGGKQSINQMKNLCKSKGVDVFETGIVNWSSKKREKKIECIIKNFCN